MTERHRRCRFWPNCLIHLGEPNPFYLSRANHTEIRQLRREGALLREIAEVFGTCEKTVARVLQTESKVTEGKGAW